MQLDIKQDVDFLKAENDRLKTEIIRLIRIFEDELSGRKSKFEINNIEFLALRFKNVRASFEQAAFYRLISKVSEYLENGTLSDDFITIFGDFLETSGFVDAEWYLTCNSDVKIAGLSAGKHFIVDGFLEGRKPNSTF